MTFFQKRRLNIKLTVVFVGGLLLLGVSTYFLHGFQVRRNAGILLQHADKAEQANKLDRAGDYLSRYLGLVPDDTDALARYGLLLADDKVATNPRALLKAYFTLEQVLRREPGRDEVRRRVIQIAMNPWLGRHGDASEHLKKLIESAGKDAELLNLMGQCREAKGEFKQARACFEDALRCPSPDMEVSMRLAYLLRNQAAVVRRDKEKPEDLPGLADALVKEMIEAEAFAKSFQAHLNCARYHNLFPLHLTPEVTRQRVAEHIAKARELAPTEPEVILAFAHLEEDNGRPREARAVLEQGVKLHARDWRMYQALARLELAQQQPTAAVDALRKGLDQLPKQLDLLWNLANLLIQPRQNAKERDAEVSALIVRLEKQRLPQAELDYLRARLRVSNEEWLKAARLLERIYPQFVSRINHTRDWFSLNLAQESSLLLAQCYEQLGDVDQAMVAYGRVVTRNPGSSSARLGLARTEWALGRLDKAEREYRQLTQLPGAPAAAWIELVQLLITRNLTSNQPDWVAVEGVLEQGEKLRPVPVEIKLLRAEALAARKQYAKAREVLAGDGADKQARPVEIWVGLASLEGRQGNSTGALALLDEAERSLGDRLELRLARARHWVRQGGRGAAQALDGLAQNPGKFTPAERRLLFRTVAACYLQIGEERRAELLWQQLATRNPNDLGSRMSLFDLALKAQNDSRLGLLVQEIRAIEGEDGTLWRYYQASRLIALAQKQFDRARVQEAEKLLKTVADRRPSWARVPLTQAMARELLKDPRDPDGALIKYRRAIQLGERNPAVIRHVANLLFARNAFEEVHELIQKLREQTVNLTGLEKVEAESALRQQDPAQALRLAEKAVAADSRDYRDHIWLGQVRWAAGKHAEAEASLRQAIKLGGNAPEPWVTLVSLLTLLKEKDRAEAVTREAEKHLLPERTALALAQCYEIMERPDRAGEYYEAALAKNPEDIAVRQHLAVFFLRTNRLAEAKKQLEKIVSLKAGNPQEAASSRRALALILASNGDYQESLRALETLGVLGGKADATALVADEGPADQRARIVVLAKAQNPSQRRQAIVLLDNLQQRKLLTRAEQFLLAQLLDSVGEWNKALAQMTVLLEAAQEKLDRNPKGQEALEKEYASHLVFTVAGLLRRGSTPQAEVWLAKLERLEPKAFPTASLQARLLAKQGRAAEGVPALLALAKGGEGLDLAAAALLEEIGQVADAERLYRQHAEQSQKPEAVFYLARFLGRRHKVDEALALCEKTWKATPVEAASTSVLILYAGQSDGDHQRQVAERLAGAIKANPSRVALLNYLAAVRRLQKDFPAVASLYREVLKHDAKDTLTLNNLAWVLALSEKNGAEALKWVQRAIELDGPQTEFLDTRAVAHLVMGNASLAVTDLDEAIAEAPTAHRYFHLAQAHHLAGKRSAAIDALRRARNLSLTEATVDPLERQAYHRLVGELDRKGK